MLVRRPSRSPLAASLVLLACASSLSAQTTWTCTSDILFEGSEEGDHIGWSVATNGNWNGDAYGTGEPRNDVLAGSFIPGNDHGVVELFTTSGTEGFPVDPTCPFAGGRVRIEGVQLGDDFGHAVAFVGDVDGDDRDDIAIGMVSGPNFGAGLTERGAVYVFLSTDTNPNGIPVDAPSSGVTLVGASEASLVIRGVADGSRCGRAIAGIGDWEGDGDGVPDFLVGAPGDDSWPPADPGHVYMVSGQKVKDAVSLGLGAVDVTAVLVDDLLDPFSTANGVITGEDPGDRMGYSIVHLGEAGDTAHGSDFAVGAPQFNGGALVDQNDDSDNLLFGYVKVFLGANAHIIRLDGTQRKERFGFALGGNVNVDDDAGGRSELVVGSPFWDEPSHTYPNAGKATVFKDSTLTPLGPPIVGVDSPIPQTYGPERLGFAVAGLGAIGGGPGDEFALGSYGFVTGATGPFSPPTSSPCAPCMKLTKDGTMGLSLGGYVTGRAQVVTYTGTGYTTLEDYWGDHKDSAGTALGFLPHVGAGMSPAVVVGAFRWGDTWFPKKEVGRVHLFLW